MNCRDAEPLLHARLDNELDVAGSLTVDRHLEECRACAAQYAALQNLQQEIAAADLGYPLPVALERRLAGQFTPRATFLTSLWSRLRQNALAAAAVAIAVILIISVPLLRTGEATDIGSEILDNHLRALQPDHLVDVRSSDQHTVKPWFQGRTSFSPPVPDLTNDGFNLIGGRLEVIRQQPTAAIVYQRRLHVISMYVSSSAAGDAKPEFHQLGGYHLLHWNHDHLSYWAVSDVAQAELDDFASLINQTKGNNR